MPLQHAALRNNNNINNNGGSHKSKQRGAYTKVKPIGKGAFGEVFLVTRPGLSEQLVLKEVSMKGMSPRDKKATQNEVTILKKLSHPNIVAFHESFIENEVLCVVMEYAPGGDLSKAIVMQKKTGRRFPESIVLRYLAEIVCAMAYCHHDLHLLHRDLKPQNVFIGRGGKLQLGDFGISKVMAASKAMAQTQCGTPLYMAPELCRGARYDRGADSWAIGCVLYELMALAPPWMDRVGGPNMPSGISGLMKLITSGSLNLAPLRAHYSPELCSLLGSLLAKAPLDRPSLTAVLAMPLVKNALPPQSQQPSPAHTPQTPAPPLSTPPVASRPGSASKYRPGAVVMVKRTSGAETMAVVDRHEASNGLYTLTLLSPVGEVEGSKQAPEPCLRAPSTAQEKQLMRQDAIRKQQRVRTPGGGGGDSGVGEAGRPYRGEWAQGGIEEHAAAIVLQQAFASKRAAQVPEAQPQSQPLHCPQAQQRKPGTPDYWSPTASPPGSASKYRPGAVVMVKRTSGAETMAVVDRHEASNGLYTLTLLSPVGEVEGSKQAPEPCLRAPSTAQEKQLMRQQEQRKSAAQVLQRSFQRNKAPSAPPPALAAILESPNAAARAGHGQRQPLIYKHAANAALPQAGVPQQPAGRQESLRQQQQRLANCANANRFVRPPHTPFRPLLA